MSDATKAVFLSYASQDAEAAKKICDALRGAGVEVWFDQSELVGGDSWDAKIRGQISSCGLFVPVISANTQARREGYFRLEWKLAAQRTHMIADGTPFLVPVVIDGTKDADALVPAEFKAVQWTRLTGGETSPSFVTRVKKLLTEDGGSSSREAGSGTASRELGPPRGASKWWWALPIFGMAMALLLVMKETRKEPAVGTTPPAPAAPPVSEADQLVRQARELIYDPDSARNEFALAASLLKRATDLAPASGAAWGASALLNHYFFSRAYDTDRQRLVRSQAEADQALRLDPRNPDALLALGLHRQELGELDRARDYFDRARTIDPDNSKVVLAQGFQLPDPRARAKYLLDAAPTVTRPAELYYYAGINLRWARQYEAARGAIDQAIAARPFWRAYVMRADMEYMITADPAKIDAWLDKVPEAKFDEPRVAYMRYHAARLRRDGAGMARALRGIAADYLQDSFFIGPKAYLLAQAYTFAGQPGPALEQWQIAERSVREKLAAEPNVINWRAMLAVILAGQQRMAEAKAAADALAADERSGQSQDLRGMGVLTAEIVAHAYMAVGDPAQAIAVLRRPRPVIYTGDVSSASLAADPAYDSLRRLPGYAELLAELKHGENAAPAGSSAASAPAPKVDDKSVAVLAFTNLSDDKDNEYFSDGISEELLNVLAKIPELKVTARTSSFHFKGTNTEIPEIARQLGVAYVVEGSVRKQGDKVRITAQLIKAADGFHVWSDTFTRELKDIFAVQDEIAGLIAKNLELKLGMTPERVPANPEAFSLLLQGRFFARQESTAGRKQSIEFYRRAIGLEPGYALAWAELAQSYIRLARFGGMPTAEGVREARIAAEKSLGLDPDQPIALDALGWVQRTADWDWRGAQKTFQHALALAPENAAILTDAAILYFNVGRIDEALALARKAVDRDPLNAMAQISLGDLLMQAGGIPESIGLMNQGLKLAPGVEEFRTHLAVALTLSKRAAEADAMVEQEPNESYRLWGRGIIAGIRGDRAGVSRAREALVARNDATMTGYVAMLFVAEGKTDDAFAWLERSFRERDSSVCWVKTAHYYDPIRDDPRWKEFVRKLGLADDQLK